jgi:hypothetical protein
MRLIVTCAIASLRLPKLYCIVAVFRANLLEWFHSNLLMARLLLCMAGDLEVANVA